jgi:uncharacterized protein
VFRSCDTRAKNWKRNAGLLTVSSRDAAANSSPLIIFAKLNCFDLLHALYPQVYVSEEVYSEVVVSGTGLSGASEVAKAEWIEVRQLPNQAELLSLQEKYALGIGELSTIVLAKEMRADVVSLDDYNARKLAKAEGLQVHGSVGLLETLYLRGHLPDLRTTFRQRQCHPPGYTRAASLGRKAHDFHRAMGMTQDRLRHTSDQESLHSFSSVRAKDN